MKAIDYLLQKMRINQAARFIKKQDAVLDIGSYDGALFKQLSHLHLTGAGVDPLANEMDHGQYQLIKGYFPQAFTGNERFNCIAMLAVLEHIPAGQQEALAKSCHQFLHPGGLVIITVPSPSVDYILAVLRFFRLIDGMSLEEHYGFKTSDTKHIFSAPLFRLVKHKKFQFGLNHLFVFEKVS